MVLRIAGYGVTGFSAFDTGFNGPLTAGRINYRVEPTENEVLGSSDCGIGRTQVIDTIIDRQDEFIDFDTSIVSDHVLSAIKGQTIAPATNVTFLKTACVTVDAAALTVTSVENAELTGLAATVGTVTGTFSLTNGSHAPANILLTGTADNLNDVVIGANQVTLNAGNAGQVLNLYFTTTGNLAKAMGGPTTEATHPSHQAVSVFGKVQARGYTGIWTFWAPNAILTGNRGLDTSVDSNTLVYRANTQAGWRDGVFIYQE